MAKTETKIDELKINYLTEAQYQTALSNGEINENEIYMTPNNATIPTKTSDLTNDSGFLTSVPTAANGTLGVVKTTSSVSSTSGLTACPVISGVVYYKDTDSDTKNTAGSTNTSSKIFLIGATSQAANPQTYSHDTAYVGTDGCLYSNSTKVSVEGHTHSYSDLTNTPSLTTTGTSLSTTNLSASGQAQKCGNVKAIKWIAKINSSLNQGASLTLCTLPSDYRPTYQVEKTFTLVNLVVVQLDINTNGTVVIKPLSNALSANDWVTLYEVYL